MRHFAVALLAATTLGVGAAAAADLPTKAPTYSPAPLYNWAGFYVGGHIGGAWSNTNSSDPTGVGFAPVGASVGINGTGFLGGAQIGDNWQAGNWVFGIQGDMSWTSINASATDPFFPFGTLTSPLILNDKVSWLGTAAGRIGYAWNNLFWYGKAGGAWVHNNYHYFNTGGGVTGSDTRGGWSLGTGLEYGLTPNWTTFIEYDYIGLGTHPVIMTGPFSSGATPIQQNISMVKAGVNYKFGGL